MISINTRNAFFRFILWMVLLVYMIIITKLIIFKRPLGYIKRYLLHEYSWVKAKAHMKEANLQPFKTIKLYLYSHIREEYAISNLAGNIVGFIPLGLLLPLLFPALRTAFRTILCVCLVSIGFELVQLVSMLGVCDIDDVILNTLGGAVGYLLFFLLTRLVSLDVKSRQEIPPVAG